jgi:excisionase family DNA binding protein
VSFTVPLDLTHCSAIIVFVNYDTDLYLFGEDQMIGQQEDRLFSVVQAAEWLGGISKWTIHAWLSKGRLQRTKVGGRTMIRESELAKMIEDGGKSAGPRRATAPAKGRHV